jgi:hypothetical protein
VRLINSTQRCPINRADYAIEHDAHDLTDVNAELRKRHVDPSYRQSTPNGQDMPPLVTSKEYFRDATSHVQRISHLSQQNNTRLAKGLRLHQPLKTKHLSGPQAHVHWQPVAVIEELADDLEEYWKKHKYAVTHRKAIFHPRNDQERAVMNRQHATGQVPLGVRVIELTFAPSQEPLLHLMGEIRDDSDEKTITLDYD